MHGSSTHQGSLSRRSRLRRGLTALAAALAVPLLGLPLTAAPASALTAPVALTADNLSTWQTNGVVYAMAQSGGQVFAGGTFSAIRPAGAAAGAATEQSAVNFAAFDASTGAPTGCTLSFTVGSGTATVRALAVSPDGSTLYAGGYFGAVNGVGVSSLAAINIATCTPSSTFHPAVSSTVRALDVSGSTIYLGGDFTTVNATARQRFAAVTSTGALTGWTADTDAPGRAVNVTADGEHVAIGGDFFTVNGTDSHALAVTDATTGAVTKAYPRGFFPDTSVVKDITSDASGMYTANEGTGGGVFDGRTAFDPTTFDQKWRDTCLGATQALQIYQGLVYSASHAHDCSSMGEYPDGQRRHLLAEGTDDPTLVGWAPDTNDGIGEGIGPRVFALAPDGGTDYLWVGGEFTTVNGSAQQGLTRVSSGPDTGAPTLPQVKVESNEPGKVQVHWRSSYDTDDSHLTYRVYKDTATTPVYTVAADSLPWSRPQLTWTDTSVAAGETHSYRLTASDGTNTTSKTVAQSVTVPSTAEAYASAVKGDGASLYWRFGEASGAYAADSSASGDDSGVHWNAPAQAVTDAAAGSGSAVRYTGTSSQWTYTDKRHSTPSSFSVELWFKTASTTGGKLIGFGDKVQLTSSSYDKHVYMTSNGRLVFGVYPGSAKTVTTTASYNNNAWHHVVATEGSTGIRLYVDGVLRASDSTVTSSQQYNGYWRVGGDSLSGWPNVPSSIYYSGLIDEVAVYNSVLTPSQIAAHYSLGSTP